MCKDCMVSIFKLLVLCLNINSIWQVTEQKENYIHINMVSSMFFLHGTQS